jgi:hypothetical protein
MRTTILASDTGSLRVVIDIKDLPENIPVNDELHWIVDNDVVFRFRVTKKTWRIIGNSDTGETTLDLYVHGLDEWSNNYLKGMVERTLRAE